MDEKKWNYENLDDDLAELNRNLLALNNQNTEKARNMFQKLRLSKSEKKLKETVEKLRKV